MKITKHFDTLSEEVKETICNYGHLNKINRDIRKLNTEENRSLIYKVIDADIILKEFLPKGKRDEDINALIDLDGIDYFPKLYAYKENQYFFMEKAQGVNLSKFIEDGATDTELNEIKGLLINAFSKMLDRGRKDWDFKLEHIFWCKKNKKLTWIDFSICENYRYSSKEVELKNFEEYFKELVSRYVRIYRKI